MTIDTDQIRERLPSLRWFGAKSRTIESVDVFDHAPIDEGPPAFVIALVNVHFADGGADIYHLPLLVDDDGSTIDAFEQPDRLGIYGDLMAHGASIHGTSGVFHFGGPGLDPSNPPGAQSARLLAVEQSNTSLVLDENLILKTFRRVAIGSNPDLELTRLLTAEGFTNIPAHVGEITYVGGSDEQPLEIDLAVAQQFVADGVEGWTDALQRLRDLYDAVDPADANEDIPFLIEERAKNLLDRIEELGEATAGLHVTLSREQADPELAPEPAESFDLDQWSRSASQRLSDLAQQDLVELRPLLAGIEERIARVSKIEQPGMKTRIHGDYHLGQVLHTPKGWLILDFEGEPARTLEERRAKHSPLKDVAGMLRSFSYAASASLSDAAGDDDAQLRRLEPWSLAWEELARQRFTQGYLKRSHEGDFLPPDRQSLLDLLDFFEIDKALYELGYELSHRPDWIHIPLRGIRQVIERGETR